MSAMYAIGHCLKCEHQNVLLIPLHGDSGGPLLCPICVGKWQAEHGRRRRAGRVVIRALKAFEEAGGSYADFEKLKLSAIGSAFGVKLDPLGYLAGVAKSADEIIELTSDLLADALRLAHPDGHPPERQVLAHRVTQQLLVLKPFVFPAPKPKPIELQPARRPWFERTEPVIEKQTYPCAECASTTPYWYCSACRAECNKRQEAEHVKEREKRRGWRAKSNARRRGWRDRLCEICGTKLEDNRRIDIRFCSATCRQKGHRKSVTDKQGCTHDTPIRRDTISAQFEGAP